MKVLHRLLRILRCRGGGTHNSSKRFYRLVFFSALLYFIFFVSFFPSDQKNKLLKFIGSILGTKAEASSSRSNYFQKILRILSLGSIVNTSTCKIPDFDVWDEDALPFIKISEPPENCRNNRNWSYIKDDNKLILNYSEIEKEGYSVYKGFCCYKVIRRVTLGKKVNGEYNGSLKNADNSITYSDCIDIVREETVLQDEFIMVVCGIVKVPAFSQLYRGFHAIASVNGSSRKDNILRKVNYWKNRGSGPDKRLPPNIVIFGIDSTSRLNVRRNMFKTKALLEELGAVEMLGYTKGKSTLLRPIARFLSNMKTRSKVILRKDLIPTFPLKTQFDNYRSRSIEELIFVYFETVGDNTSPNILPMKSGYSEEDLKEICYPSYDTPHDDCPYDWKRFDLANYITLHAEDAPGAAIFNYLKTGFVQQPVDFYLRPFFIAAYDYENLPLLYVPKTQKDKMYCVGQYTNDEVILGYVQSALDFSASAKTPIYSFSWSTTNSHDESSNIQLVDNMYANLLKKLEKSGFLNNTVLILMGDHGYRHGNFRKTLLGFYEDKLPAMWIRLPPWMKEALPEWQTALKLNARRLTSHYTMFWSINTILEKFTSLGPLENSRTPSGVVKNRKYRQSFFKPVPENNTCESVGVPEQYCACYTPQAVNITDPIFHNASTAALNIKNNDLPPSCSPLKVKSITAGTVFDKLQGTTKVVVVSFMTEPGQFTFEAEIAYYTQTMTFNTAANLLRTNRINRHDVRCIRDPKLELYCYCVD